MRSRLLLKILFGFWITFFVIIQGIWLLFILLRSEPYNYARGIAAMSLTAASGIIQNQGLAEYAKQSQTWPGSIRRQIVVADIGRPAAKGVLAQQDVRTPQGGRYRLVYRSPELPNPFHIPGEVLIVGAIGGLLFSALLAWYLTQPIRRIRDGFHRLSRGELSTRLGPAMGSRRDEIADLAVDFDLMAARLEEHVAARDRLLADVSHELRTPLARLSVAIGLIRLNPDKLPNALDRIEAEVGKLDEMVGELLVLSKLESGAGPTDDYYGLLEVTRQVCEDAGYEAAPKGIAVKFRTDLRDGDGLAKGNGTLASRAVENIVRNAVRYSPPGGSVHVDLGRRGEAYDLTVTDTGPGISNADISRLFKPFSVSADGSGFGLGLSIAHRAIAVNGGRISIRNREEGGLEIRVNIPAATLEL